MTPKKIIVIVLVGVILTASCVVILQKLFQRTQLILNNFELWDHAMGKELLWASVSMKDPEGKWVTGLSLKDFNLSEALLDSQGNVIQELPITFNRPNSYYQFYGEGFWEKSVTSEKLDIVFLLDKSGSMEDEMPGIYSELHKLVNRLQSEHVDFRMAIVKYDWSPIGNSPAQSYDHWAFTMPFRGTMEAKEIHQWLDNVQLTGGEWWEPAASYDQLMLAISELEFRKEARKVVVIVTDSPAQNVYGTFWYAPDCSAATLSAVELFLKDKGIEVLYSQPEKLRHLAEYCDVRINPKALAGFETFGTRISWPFRQEDYQTKGGSIVDSQYFFSWMSQLKLPGDPHDYTVKVTIKAADPSRPNEWLECSFSYIPYLQTARLTANVYDEEGKPTDDVWVYFYREMGDRKICIRSQEKPKNGVIMIERMPIGNYYIVAVAHGNPVYSYETLRYEARLRIEVPVEGINFTLRVRTGEREMELAKARGLLKDLDESALSGSPFKDFATKAEKWLDEIEANGITWREMVAIKRFYVALSGYANFNEYARQAAEGAVEDFTEIIQDIREIVKQLKILKEAREASFKEILAAATLTLAYDIITSGRFTAAKEAVNTGYNLLVAYIERELVPELISEVLEQIPAGPYKPIIAAMIGEYTGKEYVNVSQVIEKEINEKILKPYYIDKAKTGLYAALESAKSYVPQGEEPDDWISEMSRDFYEYRKIVDEVQDKAWKALSTQEAIENWAERLEGLVDVIENLADALYILATFYPPFRDEAKAVRGTIEALNGIQVIPKAIELGLEIDCIDTLGDKAALLSTAAF